MVNLFGSRVTLSYNLKPLQSIKHDTVLYKHDILTNFEFRCTLCVAYQLFGLWYVTYVVCLFGEAADVWR